VDRQTEGNSQYETGKRELEKYRCRWEDKIKMDLREIGWDGAHWIHLPHN
jgi:hypothetical protein